MKSMKDMKINFPAYILHALHVLHGEIKYSMLKFMTLRLNPQKKYESSLKIIGHPIKQTVNRFLPSPCRIYK